MNHGIQPMAWFAELMEEVQRFRAEERAAFFTKNVNSLVKVTFTYPAA